MSEPRRILIVLLNPLALRGDAVLNTEKDVPRWRSKTIVWSGRDLHRPAGAGSDRNAGLEMQ